MVSSPTSHVTFLTFASSQSDDSAGLIIDFPKSAHRNRQVPVLFVLLRRPLVSMSRVDLHRMNINELVRFDSRTSIQDVVDRELTRKHKRSGSHANEYAKGEASNKGIASSASLHVDGTPTSLFVTRAHETRDEESLRRFEERMNPLRLFEERQKRAVHVRQLHEHKPVPPYLLPHSPPHSPRGENQDGRATASSCVLL